MNIYSHRVATNLLFGTPTIILGPMGSGKEYIAKEALRFLSGDKNNLNANHIDFYSLVLEKFNYVPDWNGPLNRRSDRMQMFDKQIEESPDKVIFYTTIEYVKTPWLMHMTMSALFKRKVVMVGETLDFAPLLERCDVMRM